MSDSPRSASFLAEILYEKMSRRDKKEFLRLLTADIASLHPHEMEKEEKELLQDVEELTDILRRVGAQRRAAEPYSDEERKAQDSFARHEIFLEETETRLRLLRSKKSAFISGTRLREAILKDLESKS